MGWSAPKIVRLMDGCRSASAKGYLCKDVFGSVFPSVIAILMTVDHGVVAIFHSRFCGACVPQYEQNVCIGIRRRMDIIVLHIAPETAILYAGSGMARTRSLASGSRQESKLEFVLLLQGGKQAIRYCVTNCQGQKRCVCLSSLE